MLNNLTLKSNKNYDTGKFNKNENVNLLIETLRLI